MIVSAQGFGFSRPYDRRGAARCKPESGLRILTRTTSVPVAEAGETTMVEKSALEKQRARDTRVKSKTYDEVGSSRFWQAYVRMGHAAHGPKYQTTYETNTPLT